MTFSEAEAYLFALGNEVETMKLGLENIRTLLAELGHPQNSFRKIQVAGTNGKGSVCAFLDSICNAAGLRTAMFTSPHLVSVRERIRIDGSDIADEDFARVATIVREAAERAAAVGKLDSTPTFFEQITAIALLAFADAGVEVAILETGLGGRLDATTAADAEIAAITRIDLDHQIYLGETLEEIAGEKAAIIGKHSTAVVVGRQKPAALRVVEERFRSAAKPEARFVLADEGRVPELGLRGRHQLENARVAIAAAKELSRLLPIENDAIEIGLRDARHPGRLEYCGRFLFDGAHNSGGADALIAYLAEFEQRPITLIYGAMGDKDVASITRKLFPLAESVVLTRPRNKRALTSGQIRHLSGVRREFIETDSVEEAIAAAEGLEPELILVTGSLYLVGEAKQNLRDRGHI